MRSVLNLKPVTPAAAIEALGRGDGWRLEHDVPPGDFNHRALVWNVESPRASVRYIEDARFGTRYLVVEGEGQRAIERSLRERFPCHDLEALLADVRKEGAPVTARLRALFFTTPYVSPDEPEPAYAELLQRLLASEPAALARGAAMIAEWLGWPELRGDLARASSHEDAALTRIARRALEAHGG